MLIHMSNNCPWNVSLPHQTQMKFLPPYPLKNLFFHTVFYSLTLILIFNKIFVEDICSPSRLKFYKVKVYVYCVTQNTCSQKLETHKTAHQKEFTKYDYK